jgi:glucosamine--fructose-6-phosphate aminotransferase (isomerizing)
MNALEDLEKEICMCGIVGIIGKEAVAPLLVKSLMRLEYRGYDSCGVAAINERH